MPSSTITSKGQVTVPKRVRDFLTVRTGDRLDFIIEDNERVVIRPGTASVEDLKGALHRKGRRAITLEEMEEAIAERHRIRR
jgi:antitoxin PrlF